MSTRRIALALVARLRAGRTSKTAPRAINWDLTYACPLRCGHCYSESGRRASRQLPLESLFRIADRILEARPVPSVTFSGGEPLVVQGVVDIARRLRDGGAKTSLYTSGFRLKDDLARDVAGVFDRVAVSLDGPDATVNDFLRERPGSFEEAMHAAALFDALAAPRRFSFGLEVTIMRSNWASLERFATEVVPRFPHLTYLHLGALIPTGLGSRESFVDRELLDESQMAALPALEKRLRKTVPRAVNVRVFSNLPFLMHPRQLRLGMALDTLVKLEADGRVRGMDIYEGTVGNLLDEPLSVIYPRTLARHADPFVVSELSRVRTMREWAAACRAIDLRFASDEDRARIEKRQPALPVPVALAPASRLAGRRVALDLFS